MEKGSELLDKLLHDDTERDMDGNLIEEFEGEGRSSIDGGGIPNSVYSQSIWTNVADKWANRLL